MAERRDPAEVFGAMTMMPSTACPRNLSTVSSIDRRSSAGRLAMTHEVPVLSGTLNPVQHHGRAVQGRVDADHAERMRAPGDQGPGRRVGPVGQLPDRLEDLLAGVRPHVRVVVEDAGDRLVGDSGELSDVGHDRRPGGTAGPAAGRACLGSRLTRAGPARITR